MCSWCYGFGPELAALLGRLPGARLELVMGGLRAYNRDPMSVAFREMLEGHWRHVAEASGLPFSSAALDAPGFAYDTEPACRAVVTAGYLDSARAFEYLEAVQVAFYRDGRDTTRATVLSAVAAECGYDGTAFLRDLESEEMREATRAQFERTQATGVGGFPTLAMAHGGQLYLVTSGFVAADVLEQRLAEIVRRVGGPSA